MNTAGSATGLTAIRLKSVPGAAIRAKATVKEFIFESSRLIYLVGSTLASTQTTNVTFPAHRPSADRIREVRYGQLFCAIRAS